MAWRHHFKDFDDQEETEEKNKFSFPQKNKKTNMPKEYPREISEFINSVRLDLIGSEKRTKHLNLTK